MSVTVNVVGQSAVSVSVAASTSVSVVASGGIGPAGFLTVPGTSTQAFGTFQLQAGDGITVSTTNGQFLISSYPSTTVSSLAPVRSVAGRTGTIVLQAADVTAGTFAIGRIPTIGYTALSGVPVEFTPASHTHDAAAISSGTLSIARVPTISYTALSNTPATFSPQAHTHSTTDVVAFTAAASAAAPVQSVQSRTGAVVLTRADLTAAAEVHSHSTADIVGLTAAFSEIGHTHDAAAVTAGVLGIARIPTIGYTALSGVPDSFGPGFHTHYTSDIVAFTASASAAAPVQSVAGRTGAISLAAADVAGLAGIATSGSYTSLSNVPATFAPSSHTHSTTEVVGLTAAFSQPGHTHSTGDITGYQGLPAQAGYFGPLVTDGTSATWTSRYSIVSPVLVQGAGMSFVRDTSAGQITIAFAGGTSGLAVGSLAPLALGVAAAGTSGNASREDHVHKLPTIVDITAAAASHTHDAAAVTSGVLDIGRIPAIGYTALSGVPVSFTPSTHTHDAAAIASGTIDAARLPATVSALNALTGGITIAAGANVTVSTASSTITIAAGGGGGGSAAVRTFAVANSGSGAYLIDGASNPTLTLERGQTYDLVINAAGHPFHFQTVPPPYSSGNLYTAGVTNSGTASGTIRIVVPYDAPSTLYYVCQLHGSMGGTINVVNANEDLFLRSFFTPAAPTGVTATAGNAQAVVSWTAPTIVVPPLTDYIVQFSTDIGSNWTTFSRAASTTASQVVTGLTNGTAYVFRVAGSNGIGTGAFSTASAAVTPVAVVETDAYFANVALLAPLDGNLTNFSPSVGAITASSTPTYSSSVFKFGQSFLTSGNSLSAGLPSFANTPFVVEAWLWVPSSLSSVGTTIIKTGDISVDQYGNVYGNGFSLGLYNSSGTAKIFVMMRTDSVGSARIEPNGFVYPRDQWVHTAFCKTGGFNALTMFINGVAVGSQNSFSGETGGSMAVGSFGGFVDDIRVTVGSDRGYTADFTPRTAAFPTTSTASAAVTPVAVVSAPTAVQNLAAPADACGANASWAAPASAGSSAITGYRVVLSGAYINNAGTTTQAASVRTKYIDAGREVSFSITVFAVNAVGESPGVTVSGLTGYCS